MIVCADANVAAVVARNSEGSILGFGLTAPVRRFKIMFLPAVESNASRPISPVRRDAVKRR